MRRPPSPSPAAVARCSATSPSPSAGASSSRSAARTAPGKSSLFALLAGELRPNSGTVALDGRPLASFSAAALAAERAALEQSPSLSAPFPVRDLVALGLAAVPRAALDEAALVARAIAAAGAADLADRPADRLSGGERARAHLARVLAQLWAGRAAGAGRYLLLDEPTASLDIAHQLALMEAARAEAEAGAGVLVVFLMISTSPPPSPTASSSSIAAGSQPPAPPGRSSRPPAYRPSTRPRSSSSEPPSASASCPSASGFPDAGLVPALPAEDAASAPRVRARPLAPRHGRRSSARSRAARAAAPATSSRRIAASRSSLPSRARATAVFSAAIVWS